MSGVQAQIVAVIPSDWVGVVATDEVDELIAASAPDLAVYIRTRGVLLMAFQPVLDERESSLGVGALMAVSTLNGNEAELHDGFSEPLTESVRTADGRDLKRSVAKSAEQMYVGYRFDSMEVALEVAFVTAPLTGDDEASALGLFDSVAGTVRLMPDNQ